MHQKRFLEFRDLGEARTLDPLIKSQLLYQLSYQVNYLLPACRQAGDGKETIFY